MNLFTHRLKNSRHLIEGDRLRRITYEYDLIRHLVWRDFTLRYKQSALGMLWSLLLPLAQLLVMIFLFQSVVPLKIEAYPAFVFTALLPWNWFSTSVIGTCGMFIGNRDLVRHPNFVPARLILVTVLSNMITYLVALPLLIVLLMVYGRPITPAIFALPLLMLIQGILTTGLGLLIATLNVFYRDIQHLISLVLSLLFYLVPVFYRPQSAVEQYRFVYDINPIAVLIEAYRGIFFYGQIPTLPSLFFAGITSLVVYGLGLLIYQARQHDIIDTI